MNVPAKFYASPELLKLVSNEFHTATGGFTGAVQQLANVATLPGIVGSSIGMPDIHSGYGFAVGNVAAFDLADPKGVVSPGGVGFDINCGVRLLRSDLTEEDVKPLKSKMADNLFHQVPVGVGGKSELKYQKCGQPVLIGGSMGTSSYVLVGTQGAMQQTFGSTCHGAGRAMSRAQSKKTLGYKEVMRLCESRGVTIRVATEKLIAEEAPESYKDVSQVVETCHNAGISKLVVKLRPIAVIKG
ncbi:hypothetical protein WJX82_006488 [Trebouxia sp. C0006]